MAHAVSHCGVRRATDANHRFSSAASIASSKSPATRGYWGKSDAAVAHGVSHHELTRKEPIFRLWRWADSGPSSTGPSSFSVESDIHNVRS